MLLLGRKIKKLEGEGERKEEKKGGKGKKTVLITQMIAFKF